LSVIILSATNATAQSLRIRIRDQHRTEVPNVRIYQADGLHSLGETNSSGIAEIQLNLDSKNQAPLYGVKTNRIKVYIYKDGYDSFSTEFRWNSAEDLKRIVEVELPRVERDISVTSQGSSEVTYSASYAPCTSYAVGPTTTYYQPYEAYHWVQSADGRWTAYQIAVPAPMCANSCAPANCTSCGSCTGVVSYPQNCATYGMPYGGEPVTWYSTYAPAAVYVWP
jgi:hypothetical protein